MLNHFDLYDLTAVLINIRDDIKSNSNLIILESLIKVLNDIDNYEDNQIRKKLATLNLGNDKWYFVYYDNVYVTHKILKNMTLVRLIIQILTSAKQLLKENNFNQAFDLVDHYHNLPQIRADNNFIIPKSYYKTSKQYGKKTCNKYVNQIQKSLKHLH